MNDLGYIDRKLWKTIVFQYRVDEWRKNFYQWYREEVRKKSENYGLKVYLCLEHHREGPEAVHRNHDMMRLVQQEGQQAFHLTYPEIDFRKEFGKNYLGEGKHE